MTKVNSDPIGMFQRTMQTLGKQRTGAGPTSTATSKNTLSPIQDTISLSSAATQKDSVAQALTKGMTGQSFSSVKEYGAYFLKLYKQVRGGDS